MSPALAKHPPYMVPPADLNEPPIFTGLVLVNIGTPLTKEPPFLYRRLPTPAPSIALLTAPDASPRGRPVSLLPALRYHQFSLYTLCVPIITRY